MFPRNAVIASRPEESHQSPSAAVSKIIELHLPYAHAIAAEVIRRLPSELERRDIERWAELGLVEAANSFDKSRGVQFKTFAYYRIKGAIYDGLRKMGWYPKGQYQRMRFEMVANEYLKDVSEQPRVTAASAEAEFEHLRDLTTSVISCYMLSLDAMAEEPVDSRQVSAEQAAVTDQQREHLRRCLAELPEKNRQVLMYCYFEDLTFEAIGQKLGLSKSWVCRIHARSLEMLGKQLRRKWPDAVRHCSATFSATVR